MLTLDEIKEQYGSLPQGDIVCYGPAPFDETTQVTTTPVLMSPAFNLWSHNGTGWVNVDCDATHRICNASRLRHLIHNSDRLPEKVRLLNLLSSLGDSWAKQCAYVFEH